MEMKAHFDDAHPLLSLADFFAVLLHQLLFINWVLRVKQLRSRCLPFLQSLADSFAALDERSNYKASSTPAKWRSASISIRNSGEATPRTPSTAAAAAKCSSSSSCVLTREDVGVLMAKLGLQQQTDDADAAAVGSVDDIPSLFEDNEPSFEEVREAFQVFDTNRDGYIDAQELHDVLSVLGFQEGSSMDSCKEMISAFDNDKDGRVDFHDFVRLMETSFNC